MNDSTIEQRLSQLEPEYRTFVESDFVPTTAVTLGTTEGFSDHQQDVLENAILLYLLFFVTQEELTQFISSECNTPLATATDITGGIIASLPPGFSEMQRTAYENLHPSESTTSQTPSESPVVNQTPPAPPVAEPAPATPPPATANIPVRTMEGDMEEARQHRDTNPAAVHYPDRPAAQPSAEPQPSAPPAPNQPSEPTYTTSQEALLRERQDQTNSGSDEARWGN